MSLPTPSQYPASNPPPTLSPSSTDSSSSTTPRVSSPLNPASSPLRAPLPLPEADEDQDFLSPSGRPRGAAVSSKKPLAASSNSSPTVKVISSPASTVVPISVDAEEGGLSSALSHTSRSRSPGRINDDVWRKKVNETQTPPSGIPGQLAASPAASWWAGHAKSWEEPQKKSRKRSQEEQDAWDHTKERVSEAIKSTLGYTLTIAHELLEIGTDFLELAPIPGLSSAAKALLQIWDAMQSVDLNTLSCLRLTERCAETLIAVYQEVHEAGNKVTQELRAPLNKLQESFDNVRRLLVKEASRPFIKRYLKRDEILRDIASCDREVRDALDMFSLSVSIRILKQTQEAERRRQAENQAILEAIQSQRPQQGSGNALMLTGITEEVTASPPQSPLSSLPNISPISLDTLAQMPEEHLRATIDSLQRAQNAVDCAQDTEKLCQLMRLALQTTSDADILDILQIKKQDMPEAIKTLRRALERLIEREHEATSPVVVTQAPSLLRRFSLMKPDKNIVGPLQRVGTLDSTNSSAGSAGSAPKGDILHKEFLESGIEALVRMSSGVETNLPSWTITKYEVDRVQKIGVGFFSDVYKGTWRGRTVAIKVLADTTPRELFKREVAIWKTLKHPNVLELYGASSTTGDPPWFFVSPYEKNASLTEFLRKIKTQDRSSGSSFGSGKSPHRPGGSLLLSSSPNKQPTFPFWPGVNSPSQIQAKGNSPMKNSEHRRSRDLHRFIYEIAKGMDYLHRQNVHHGDLKCANVLVDDNLHCVISDFGQSEMKSEAFSISGALPPHGTLRWQAPELMQGSSHLTKEMDVYSYAICCVEVLTWGNLPWALLDDLSIQRLVLEDNERPPLPGSKYLTPELQDLIRCCWDEKSEKRPPFSQILPRLKNIRKTAADILDDFSSPRIAELPELDEDYHRRPSPDMRPIPLPNVDTTTYTDISDSQEHEEASVFIPNVQFPEPVIFTPTSSRQQSVPASTSSDDSGSSYIPPIRFLKSPSSLPPENELISQSKDERRYRMILTHDYHPSLVLPLWEPSPVDLGAVGYLSKPRGIFITLFNAHYPNKCSLEAVRAIPKIDGYGRVRNNGQRVSKRNQFFDTVMGFLKFANKDKGDLPPVIRRYTRPLHFGHKAAFLCAETTEYRYMASEEGEQLEAPKRWFKANIDTIMKIYGVQHQIQREDLFLVVGTLRAPNYALFVSHNHPEGHAHFNVFANPKKGQPWGMFTTDSIYEGVGPSFVGPEESSRQSSSKVSDHDGTWDTILLARLRFKPDGSEPTTL